MDENREQLLVDSFHVVSGMILLSFAKHELNVKDRILRNLLARTEVTLKSILNVWLLGDVQNCLVLHRCMLDRLFHVAYLSKTNSFEDFEKWSFLKQYNANNKVASDKEFRQQSDIDSLLPSPDQKKRYSELSKLGINWKRPNAESVAKKMGLSFLYKYGYDYSSTHVHPMADDGLEDFYNITGLEPRPNFPDQSMVLSNSALAATLILQEILNSSSFNWRAVIYNYIDNARRNLENDSDVEYRRDVAKVGIFFTDEGLCEVKV